MQAEYIEQIYSLIGSRCQVFSHNNKLLFVGKIAGFDRDRKQLKLIDYKSEEVPWKTIVSDMEIKIRINFQGETNQFLFIDCIIDQSMNEYLLASVKTVLFKEESRDNFRQTVMADCMISKEDSPNEEQVCTVVNISATGIGIESREEYEEGEHLLIINRKFRQEGPAHNLRCRIVRKRTSENGFFYGCMFVDLIPNEERSLMGDIFALQREELRAKGIR